jgi:NADH dehydrogenase/NADH:ubiquinone oxidoreductase subunit G
MTTSCTLAATEGLEVKTDTPEIRQIRKGLLELYLAQAPDSDDIKKLAARYGLTGSRFARPRETEAAEEKCVLCGLCVRICNEAIGAGVINFISRGPETKVNSPYLEPSDKCIGCTACADVCPTGVITITDRDGRRMVETWSQTEVPLKKCSACGDYLGPEPMTEFVYRSVPDLTEELKDLCSKCRRRLKLRKFALMTK